MVAASNQFAKQFAKRVIAWQRRAGRHALPWQGTTDPYRIWLSEIMLQQTQVGTVTPYYLRFVASFPDVAALARASQDAVLTHWAGLGYYSRARNLHRAAQMVCSEFGGRFPSSREQLTRLPGVGRSTAAAIAVFAFGQREAILDGNVKRVLARARAIEGYPGVRAIELKLWELAESLLPDAGIEAYTQGLMDLGATVCTTRAPKCPQCPLRSDCLALTQAAVERYPTAKPRRAVPQRRTTMLVLRDGRDILLEKRPSSGIWGGLWSFPEFDSPELAQAAAPARFGCEVGRVARMPRVKHGFTHFMLEIDPVIVEVSRRLPVIADAATAVWLPIEDARGAAVPAPISRILAKL